MQTKDALEQWFSPAQVTTAMDRHTPKSLGLQRIFKDLFVVPAFTFTGYELTKSSVAGHRIGDHLSSFAFY